MLLVHGLQQVEGGHEAEAPPDVALCLELVLVAVMGVGEVFLRSQARGACE